IFNGKVQTSWTKDYLLGLVALPKARLRSQSYRTTGFLLPGIRRSTLLKQKWRPRHNCAKF
ncbi:Monocarboxylate Transporter 8, partial [Manis pentadactyla]